MIENIPEREKWLHENQEALDSVIQGIKELSQGGLSRSIPNLKRDSEIGRFQLGDRVKILDTEHIGLLVEIQKNFTYKVCISVKPLRYLEIEGCKLEKIQAPKLGKKRIITEKIDKEIRENLKKS